MSLKITCIILNVLSDDFHTIWEVTSVVKSKIGFSNEGDMLGSLFHSLSKLLDEGYINIYKGTSFQGEERQLLEFTLSEKFIRAHLEDWKIKEKDEEDFRFYISTKGQEYYFNNCDTEIFK